jgi:lysophospholipase L1-like esterase
MILPVAQHQTENPPWIAMFVVCLASTLLDAAPLKILPLGDSITHGFNGINYPNGSIPGGYRRDLGNRLALAGIPHDFLGSRTDNAGTGMDPQHEGHPGFRTDQALAKLTSWLAGNPDIVLMHLGTNDLIQHIPLATAVANLSTLIQRITTNAPQRILYVATIIPIIDERDGHTAAQWATIISSYNAQIRSLVRQHAGAGRRVKLVDMNANLVYSNFEVKKRFFQPGDGNPSGAGGI